PLLGLVYPGFKPLVGVCRWDEKLDFHLFEFTRAEDKVPGRDFVTEGLTDLGNTVWWFLALCIHHIQKVQVHTLGGFWSQIVEALFVSNRSKDSAYQSRKRTWLSHFSADAAVLSSKLRMFRSAPVFFFECFD